MNQPFASLLVSIAVLAGTSVAVQAQESNTKHYGTLEGHAETPVDEVGSETEPAAVKTKQDSIAIRSVKKATSEIQKPSPKKASAEDEAPFNFLYYIIQRFKTSDIIED
jgi:hypothetical protein